MPKGVYKRTPKDEPEAADTASSTKPRRAAKAKRAKHAKKLNGHAKPVGAATFVVDDRGAMHIRDGQQTIQLERADVQRLVVFLDRTKLIRT